MQCLLLNADYTPLRVISWQKAFILNYKDLADVVAVHKSEVTDSLGRYYARPSIIRLRKYIKRKSGPVPYSKRNIFLRDKGKCGYCGIHLSFREATFDHIIPISKWNRKNGSPSNWQNMVTCCFSCNQRKADRTPEEANMKLNISTVKIPKYGEICIGFDPFGVYPQEWSDYLTYGKNKI